MRGAREQHVVQALELRVQGLDQARLPVPVQDRPPGGDGVDQLAPVLERFHERLEAEGEEELRGILGAIDRRTAAYADKRQFFVDRVMEGVGLICAAFHPRPVRA